MSDAENDTRYGREAVVQDENMRRAFQEGFSEGIVSATQAMVWRVSVLVDDTKINETTTQTSEEALEFASRYISQPEVTVTITNTKEDLTKEIEAGQGEVIEGEVVGEEET